MENAPSDSNYVSSVFSRRTFLGVTGAALATAVVGSTAGCAAAPRSSAVPKSTGGATGRVTIAVFQEPDSLDPGVMGESTSYQIAQSIFDQLTYEINGKAYPGLAESYLVSPDAKTYTFKLRKGVKFHDGTPFNAAALRANFEHIMNPASKSLSAASALGPYKQTNLIDEYTAQLVFSEPNAAFINEMTAQPFGISSPTAIEKYGSDYSRHPVGTGPFMFKHWITGQDVALVRNPDYQWGPEGVEHTGPAIISDLTFRILPDPAAQANALQTNEITIGQTLNPQDIVRLLATKKFAKHNAPITGLPFCFEMNMQKAPTDDILVRKAIIYATDVDTMLKSLYFGMYEKAVSCFARGTPGFDEKLQNLYAYDPREAGRLLDQAGWRLAGGTRSKNGQQLTLSCINISAGGYDNPSQLLQANLKAVGINMDISDQAWPAVRATYEDGPENIADNSFEDVDPIFSRYEFGGDYIKTGENFCHFANPSVDAAITMANATVDIAERDAMFARIGATIMQEAPMIPIHDNRGIYVASTGVRNLVVTVNGVPMFNRVTSS